MGLNLRLLPCESWHQVNGRLWGYSHTILELGSLADATWDAFQTRVMPHLAKLPADHSVTSFVGARDPDGLRYGTLRAKDAYGEPYEVVTAVHLLPWLELHFRYDGCDGGHARGPYQTAIVAYVRALPPDTKIVLDWQMIGVRFDDGQLEEFWAEELAVR